MGQFYDKKYPTYKGRKSKVRIWVGTDALTLTKFPPGSRIWYLRILLRRMFYRIAGNLFDVHWVVHKRLTPHLLKIGIHYDRIKVIIDDTICRSCENLCSKKKHEDFTILYYAPKRSRNMKFKRWVYGLDIIDRLKQIDFSFNVRWIEVDGTQDMCSIYPSVDCMVRPSRHDGNPRMVMECKLLEIPYYWDESFEPKAQEIAEFILKTKEGK